MASSPAERMKAMRQRRQQVGLREIRLLVPDTRSPAFRRKLARWAAKLDPRCEQEAMDWIESVSEFDNPTPERR